MKEIIVAIDFSKCSLQALDFAILIANRFEADIIMIWVNSALTDETIFATDEESQARKEAKGYFEEIISEYSPKLTNGKLKFKLRKGKVFQEIAMQARNDNAFLLLTGTHGVTGYEEYWIGSNAYRIVTHSPCPVITVRQNFTITNTIRKIVLPVDSTKETNQKLPFACEIAKVFNAEIHIVSVYPVVLKSLRVKVDANTRNAIQFLDENKVNFVVENINSDDLTRDIIKYANKVDADLIGVMTEQGETQAKAFLGPNARQLVSNSPMPLLNIRPRD